MLPRWSDHEDPPRDRAGAEAAVAADHSRPPARQPAVPARPEAHPGPPHRTGAATDHARQGSSRQSLRLPCEPLLPAQTQDRMHPPGEGRSGPQPQEARLPRRPTTGLRQGGLQGTPRGGVRDRPTETPPRGSRGIRQAGRALRGNSAGRSHQRAAVTSAFATDPSARLRPRVRRRAPAVPAGRSPHCCRC